MQVLRFPVLACVCLGFSGIMGCGEHPVYDSPGYENGLTSRHVFVDQADVNTRSLTENKLQERGYV